jgi:hypothetical protein
MKHLIAFLEEFNHPRWGWRDHQEEPGFWSTAAVVLAVLALVVVFLSQ